jgi:hypothetical protein
MATTSADADPWASADPALALAQRELHWYTQAAARARISNRVSEVALLVLSAATTVAAALGAPAWLTASLAAATLVLTGLRKTFDWHENWLSFTANRSELRMLIHHYRLLPEGQRDDEARRSLLERVDETFSSETSRWASRRRKIDTQAQT